MSGAREATARVDGRTWVEVELPETVGGDGELTLTLRNTGGAVLALLADPDGVEHGREPGLELWSGGALERDGSVAIVLRALLTLAWTSAFAFAFATWIHGASAAGSALALWLAAATFPALALTPRLPRALEIVGQGRVPGALPATDGLVLALALLAAHAIALRGLRSWRYAP